MVSLRDETTKAYRGNGRGLISKETLRRCRAYTRKRPSGLSPKHRPYAGDKQSHRPGRAGSATGEIGSGLRPGKWKSGATGPMRSAHSRLLSPMVQCSMRGNTS